MRSVPVSCGASSTGAAARAEAIAAHPTPLSTDGSRRRLTRPSVGASKSRSSTSPTPSGAPRTSASLRQTAEYTVTARPIFRGHLNDRALCSYLLDKSILLSNNCNTDFAIGGPDCAYLFWSRVPIGSDFPQSRPCARRISLLDDLTMSRKPGDNECDTQLLSCVRTASTAVVRF